LAFELVVPQLNSIDFTPDQASVAETLMVPPGLQVKTVALVVGEQLVPPQKVKGVTGLV
jgi:hypothetical protein